MFFENGLHAIQRRSTLAQPSVDKFAITSLDVVIYREKKLGAGGFGEVFEGDWRGKRVAVKVLVNGLPSEVRQLMVAY